MEVEVKIKLLDPQCIPYKKYESDTGMDLKARLPRLVSLGQFNVMVIPTGICAELPEGYGFQIRPRSGLSQRGISAELGTIDNLYRGELAVILTNNTSVPFEINPYDRIAQLVVEQVITPRLHFVNDLTNTERDAKGFGSTGINNVYGF